MEDSGLIGGGLMTITQLRKAFDHVQIIAKDIAAGSINDTSVRQFMQEWRKTFGKSLSEKEAREYLEHMKQMNPAGKKRTIGSKATRKSHQRGGGGPLPGAPIDSHTQPGVYGEYGKFLPYVASGFGVGMPTISQTRPAIPDPSMAISSDVGSGALLKGGSRRGHRGSRKQHSQRKQKHNTRRQMKGGSNIVLSTVPTSVIQDMKIAWRGQQHEMSPSPVDTGNRLRLP